MKRSKAIRFAGISILGALLVAGGFLLGRASEDGGESTTAATTVDSGNSTPGYDPATNVNSFDAADVIKLFPPSIVRDGEILDQGKKTPERALLEWWQAYQFNDLKAVLALTSQDTIDAIGKDELAKLVQLPGPGLGGVEILGASGSGDTATVEAGLLTFTPKRPGGPLPKDPTGSRPETFAMQDQDGDWRFAATEFLSLKLNALSG